MTFRFVTIKCASCDKVLGSHTASSEMDSVCYCPHCTVVIEGLRHILGLIDKQDVAKALMNVYFHEYINGERFDLWHAQMRMAVEQLGLRLDYKNWKDYRL